MSEKKMVYVLLTKDCSWFSKIFYWVSGRGYTHAAISVDQSKNNFYSFNFKGFSEEHPFRRKKAGRKSVCYQLGVSEKDYQKIQLKLEEFSAKKEEYHYSKLGLVLCVLRIPYKNKNAYFCSQFVAEMLLMIDSFQLKKEPSLYLPNQMKEVLSGYQVVQAV